VRVGIDHQGKWPRFPNALLPLVVARNEECAMSAEEDALQAKRLRCDLEHEQETSQFYDFGD